MILKNVISWFEIPVADLARAQKFYEAIFVPPGLPYS